MATFRIVMDCDGERVGEIEVELAEELVRVDKRGVEDDLFSNLFDTACKWQDAGKGVVRRGEGRPN
jgi:hypothetical protein